MWCRVALICMSWWTFFFFKQKTAYEMRISDWSSDVCSSDLAVRRKIAFMTQHVGGQFQTRLRNAVEMNRRRAIAGNVVDIEKQPADRRTKIGRASCRERVCQYV